MTKALRMADTRPQTSNDCKVMMTKSNQTFRRKKEKGIKNKSIKPLLNTVFFINIYYKTKPRESVRPRLITALVSVKC